jgi:hypothetical protein
MTEEAGLRMTKGECSQGRMQNDGAEFEDQFNKAFFAFWIVILGFLSLAF